MPCNYVLTNGPKSGQSCGRLAIDGVGRCRRCIIKSGSRDYIENLSCHDLKCRFCESSLTIKEINVCKKCLISRVKDLKLEKIDTCTNKSKCIYIIKKGKDGERQCPRMVDNGYCSYHQKMTDKRIKKQSHFKECPYIISEGKEKERICGKKIKGDYCWIHKIITLNRLNKETNDKVMEHIDTVVIPKLTEVVENSNSSTINIANESTTKAIDTVIIPTPDKNVENKKKCSYISDIGTRVMRPCFLNATKDSNYCPFHLKTKNKKKLATKIIPQERSVIFKIEDNKEEEFVLVV